MLLVILDTESEENAKQKDIYKTEDEGGKISHSHSPIHYYSNSDRFKLNDHSLQNNKFIHENITAKDRYNQPTELGIINGKTNGASTLFDSFIEKRVCGYISKP
jgi:hypothetical protein